MVERIVKGASKTLEIPVWLVIVLVPIMVSIVTIVTTQASLQAKLQIQAEINKADIRDLREKKADVYIMSRIELTLDRIEAKIDNHINADKGTGK